jgi:K+-sensing histidine kinase KdpD
LPSVIHQQLRYVWAVVAVALVTLTLTPFQAIINSTTVALALLLAVLFIATFFGSRPALLSSVLAMLCFNFFFLPPVHTFTISDPQNWIAITAFFVTAITVGQLSARARQRADEALKGRLEIERLYEELRKAFEQASHAEALRQSEALKSALLDAVTHDIRTPLTSIKASATTLLDDCSAIDDRARLDLEGRQELLEVINEEADRLNKFVESLIELARIEAGEMNLRRRWGVVDEIIAAALKRAEPLTRAHRVEVHIEWELPAVRVDSSAIAEVVYTLVDNATKYAPPNTRIRVTAGLAPHEDVQIAVEDEGPGIPASLREVVFGKFFSVTAEGRSGLNRPPGVGMGLSIARGIVQAHGGQIHIEEGLDGRGTRVVFTVPVGDEELSDDQQSGELEELALDYDEHL